MKIGVVTWYKYENYGTVLQAIAMQMFLKNERFEPELINFELADSSKAKNNRSILTKMYKKIITFIYKKKLSKKSEDFKKMIVNNCVESRKIENENDYIDVCNGYDVLLFGSDQIWNQSWYHPYYFADFDEINVKRISYAPSFGSSKISNENKLKKSLSRFSSITVREKNGQDIIKKILGYNAPIVVDPTLLISDNKWRTLEEETKVLYKDYILCYMLSDNNNHYHAIKKYAKENNKKIVYIPHDGKSYIQSKNTVVECNVGNFLYLIDNADCIITDSFHACVFSVIFKKKFFVFERHNPMNEENQNMRIYNFLESIKCDKMLLKYNSKEIKTFENINYKNLYNNLKNKINDSKEYLLKELRGK